MKAVLLYKRTNIIFVIPFLSGGLAFVAGGIILYLSGVDPVEAYEQCLTAISMFDSYIAVPY